MKTSCSIYSAHIFGGRATAMTERCLNRYHCKLSLHESARQPAQGTEHQQYLSTIQYWTEVSWLVHPPWEQVRSKTYLW